MASRPVTQRSLAGGEISNELLPRQDTVKVASGLRTMRNWWATRSGGADNRPGTKYAATAKDSHDDLRIERFYFANDDAYAIEVGEKYLRFYQLAEATVIPEPVQQDTYYLASAPSDLPSITGAGSLDAELQLRRFSGPLTYFRTTFGSGSGSEIHAFATTSGVPGGTADSAWITGNHTVNVNIVDFVGYRDSGSPSSDTASSGSIILDAKLYRVAVDGSVSEGPKAANEINVTVATAGVDPVPASYEFTFTGITWGTAAYDDRLMVVLEWAHGGAWNPGLAYELNTTSAKMDSVVASGDLGPLRGWEEDASYTAGEVVAVYPAAVTGETLYLRNEDPGTIGLAGLTASSTDPYGKLVRSQGQAGGGAMVLTHTGAQRVQAFLGATSLPGWTVAQWESFRGEIPIQVRMTWADQSAAASMSVFLARFNAAGTRLENGQVGFNTRTGASPDDGEGPHDYYLLPPAAGWGATGGAVAADDRLGLIVSEGGSGSGTINTVTSATGAYLTIPEFEDLTGALTYYEALQDSTGKDPRAAANSAFWGQVFSNWNDTDQYVPGDIVAAPPFESQPITYYASNESITSGTGWTTPVLFEGLIETFADVTTGTLNTVIGTSGGTEYAVLMATIAEGWELWPLNDVTVQLNMTITTADAALDMDVRIVRVDASGNFEEAGAYATSQDLDAHNAARPYTDAFTFTCSPPAAGWGASGDPIEADDVFAIECRFVYDAAATVTADFDIELGDTDSVITVPGSSAPDTANAYYYCVAAHSDKDPRTLIYQDDFWYPLPTNAAGDYILEIPTPFLQGDLRDLQFVQSGNFITITHRDYLPHELEREDNGTALGRWTCLPIRFAPTATPPVNITETVGGSTGSGDTDKAIIRYKVTSINEDDLNESSPGSGETAGATSGFPDTTSNVSDVDVTDTTSDLNVEATAHGLVDDDEISIITVATQDADRGNENATIALEGRVWRVDKVDDDNFTLRGTAGLLTNPAIADTDEEGYPEIKVTWNLAYIQFGTVATPVKIPVKNAHTIAFSWNAVPGASEYYIYRQLRDKDENNVSRDWGFVGSTKETTFSDSGRAPGEASGTAGGDVFLPLEQDIDFTPPDYRAPFKMGGDNPRCSAYHQNRQWFAGTKNNPQRVHGSVTGDFRNFSVHSPIIDSDSIEFTIQALQANEIQVMETLGQLVVFTNGAIWTLRGGANGVITPSEINLEKMTHEGSALIRPEPVDDSILYVQARQSVVRELRFDPGAGNFTGYQGRDLTVFSPHLFDGFTLRDMSRAAIPHAIVWMIRSDGALLGLTYMHEHDVWGWHRHDTAVATDEFLSCATVPEEGVDVLYVIVKRTVNGATAYYVERVEPRTIGQAGVDNRKASFFVDSGYTFDGTNATTTTLMLTGTYDIDDTGNTLTASEALFLGTAADVGTGYRLLDANGVESEVEITAAVSTTVATVKNLTAIAAGSQATAVTTWTQMVKNVTTGIDHLEGSDVAVLADSNYITGLSVSGGTLDSDLSRPYGVIHIGLPIEADIEMLDVDLVDDGAGDIDKNKRVPYVTLFIEDTHGLKAGFDEDSLFDYATAQSDTATSLITDKRRVRMDTRYTNHGRVLIRQSEPLPATVTAIVRHVDFGDVA